MHPACPQLSARPALGDAILIYGLDLWLALFYLCDPQTLSCISISPALGRLGWLKIQT